MYKLVPIFIIICFNTVYAKIIHPIGTIQTSGLVSDFAVDHGLVYAATDVGIVDIIDIQQQKIVDRITLDPVQTARGEAVPARIHSIDRLTGRTLLVSSGENAYRNIWIHDGETIRKIIGTRQHIFAKKAFFVDENHTIMGTFGSDIILHDDMDTYQVYHTHFSDSALGGIALNRDKTKMVVSDESGTVRVIDVATSKTEITLNSEHRDNIYRVAFRSGIVITAGQDRRVGIYDLDTNSSYHIDSDFLVYCVALSESGTTGIYSSGPDHDLQLFDTKTARKSHILKGHNAIVNKIVFVNEKAIISAGDEARIFFWVIK